MHGFSFGPWQFCRNCAADERNHLDRDDVGYAGRSLLQHHARHILGFRPAGPARGESAAVTAPMVGSGVSMRPLTPLLDRVRYPSDLRNFSPDQLRQLADELRAETVSAVSVT